MIPRNANHYMRMFPCCLSNPQETFLKLACDLYKELHGEWGDRYGWFNRKDVWSDTSTFMPYTVGLALFRKGLLETDPPNHRAGYDLSFKVTDIGREVISMAKHVHVRRKKKVKRMKRKGGRK